MASLDIIAGDLQQATVGTELTTALTVEVLDANEVPVPDQVVNFVVVKGNGSVFAGTASTNGEGVAKERWTLGTIAADSQVVEVRAVDPGTGQAKVFARFRATALPGPAVKIQMNASPSAQSSAGVAVTTAPSVRVLDAFDNGVPGVAVSFAVTNGGGSVTGASATTDADGVATVGSWTLGTAVSQNGMTATSGTLQGSPVGFQVAGVAGPPANIVVASGNNQSAVGASTIQVAFKLTDAFSNIVVGRSYAMQVTGGGGSANGGVQQTNLEGIGQIQWTLGGIAGVNTLAISIPNTSIAPLTFTAIGTVGAAYRLVAVTSINSVQDNGVLLQPQPVLQLQDLGGNAVAQAGAAVSVLMRTPNAGDPGGTGSLNGTKSVVTDVNGRAVFTDLSITGVTRSMVLDFSSPGLVGLTMGFAPPSP